MSTRNISLNNALHRLPRETSDRSLNGREDMLAVERALIELRRGRVVHVEGLLVAALETVGQERFEALARLQPGALRLAITGQRATALGLVSDTEGACLIRPAHPLQHAELLAIAGISARPAPVPAQPDALVADPCGAAAVAALALVKHARLVPAVCVVECAPVPSDVLSVSLEAIERFEKPRLEDLAWVSDARVPLAGHEHCRLVLFRDGRDGTEHVAVLVGDACDIAMRRDEPVPVRVHSACLTGDLLGSLRCDCGDQLRNAVDQLGAAGGGILLYLAQEGRGIGLANKLRAYHLQDTGLDTLDADQALGFRSDERSFVIAALMLRKLGVSRVRLLTNNPAKFRQLQDAGIEVAGRTSLGGAINEHNIRYVRAKQERAGHLPVDG